MTKCFNPNLNGTPLAAAPPKWTHVDHLEGAAYIHLHDSDNRILRLSGRAELVENGSAPKLAPTPSIKPIVFDPTIEARMAVRNLKALVTDFLPVHPDQRWIVISWLLSAFFLDLVRQRALRQISGEEGSGKSTVAEMLGCLLYGCSVDRSATQALARVEAGNPLLSLDPPQNGNGRLLLGLAQGIFRNPALAMFTGAGRGFEGLSPWIFGSLKLAQKQLRHATVTTTGNIYTHVREEKLDDLASILGEALGEFCCRTVVGSSSEGDLVQ